MASLKSLDRKAARLTEELGIILLIDTVASPRGKVAVHAIIEDVPKRASPHLEAEEMDAFLDGFRAAWRLRSGDAGWTHDVI